MIDPLTQMCDGGPDCACFCTECGEHLERCECNPEDYCARCGAYVGEGGLVARDESGLCTECATDEPAHHREGANA